MATILPFVPRGRGEYASQPIAFSRAELKRIVDLYGRMVAAGLWKDYAIELRPDAAAFWAFRRASERPEYRIVKTFSGWTLIGEAGQVLRRGELGPVLAPVERRLLKLVAV